MQLDPQNRTGSFRTATPCPIPQDAWIQQCNDRLRQRLPYFPCEYDFFIQRTLRELVSWVTCLVGMLAGRDLGRKEQAVALCWDLVALTFHGVCLGVEWLGFYGYGFRNECRRLEVVKLLAAVRGADGATISRRELQRDLQWLKADMRDAMLERLAHEGLVTLSDKYVSAVSAADYLRTIPARSGIPAPTLRWEQTLKQNHPQTTAK